MMTGLCKLGYKVGSEWNWLTIVFQRWALVLRFF